MKIHALEKTVQGKQSHHDMVWRTYRDGIGDERVRTCNGGFGKGVPEGLLEGADVGRCEWASNPGIFTEVCLTGFMMPVISSQLLTSAQSWASKHTRPHARNQKAWPDQVYDNSHRKL